MDLSDAVGPLVVSFDASLRTGGSGSASAAVGYVIEDGTRTVVADAMAVDAFVSSADLEYRALLEATRALDGADRRVGSVHVRGDADAVIRAVDPTRAATPESRLARRRAGRIRDHLAGVPIVTYESVPRSDNERAHALARAGHRR